MNRTVVIDPRARTITERRVRSGIGAIQEIVGARRLEIPVINWETGDALLIDPAAPPAFAFLGEARGGVAVIAGRDLREDAVVPLQRVISQVRWGERT